LALACGGGYGGAPQENAAGKAGRPSSELGDAGASQGGARSDQGGAGQDVFAGEGGATSSPAGQGGDGQALVACEPACEAPEECVDGVCECAPDLERCGDDCTDTQQDELNCGECGVYCGNGDCVDGTCACPEPLSDCSQHGALLCRDLQSDESACGECGLTCQAGGLCAGGSCDTSVEWVRIYGTETTNGSPAGTGRLVTDAQSNLFAAVGFGQGPYSELPDGEASLWEGGSTILKFDPEGSFQWAVPSFSIRSLAVVGSDVWALGYDTTSSQSIAGHTFDRASGHAAMTVAVKLNGESGAVSDSFQLDHLTREDLASSQLLSNGTELWVVSNGGQFKLGDTTWQPPSSAYRAFLYPRGGTPVWLPGLVRNAVAQGGDAVVLTALAGSQSYSFGGDTLTAGAQGGRAIARYSSATAHESSFLIDWHWLTDGVFTASSSSYLILGQPQKPFFQQYDASGMPLGAGSTSPPFGAVAGVTHGGRIFASGYVRVNGGTVGEREFAASAAWLATFVESTLELERAMTFEPELPTHLSGPAGILDMVLTGDESSAVLLTSYKRGLLFRNREYDFGANSVGIALVKVMLY
jgi:hypothetical protein